MLTFYYTPGTIALASHIALEEAAAEYRCVRLDFAINEQRGEAYRAINPKARVPSLVTDRGVLTETPAILAFIAQAYPAANLAPIDDPFGFALIQAFTAYLCSTVHVARAHRMRAYRWADDPETIAGMQRAAPRVVSECYHLIETRMLKGPWVMGEAFTICDPYLFTLAQWLEADGVDPALIPCIIDHRRRMSERPSVVRALAQQRA